MTDTSSRELAALLADLGLAPSAPPQCSVTELLVDQCAHCRPAPPAPARSGLGPWFSANYRGDCAGCGAGFDLFDEIRADGEGGWLGACCGHVDDVVQAAPLDGLLAPEPTYTDPTDQVSTQPVDNPPPAPARPAGPPPSTVAVMRDVLADLDASRPRSRQTTLGPSELGTPCQRQIAMKLAGVPRQLPDARPPWAPMQGTAMHTLMEEALRFHNAQLGRERWVVEERLRIDDDISGHGDAFDTDTGTVVDWKYVGVTTLRDVKRKTIPNDQLVKPDYRVQAHIYGYGHQLAGRDVHWVRLVFLARSHNYDDSAEWTEAYDPEIAINAIARYHGTHDLIRELALATTPALWPVVPAAPGKACDWCPFRRPGGPADATGCPGNTQSKIGKQVVGLIA